MSLELKLVSRLMLVALLSFLAAVVWILVDTRAAIRADLSATQARVSYQLERMHRLGSGPPSPALLPENAIEIVLVMAPGTCVIFSRKASDILDRRLCAGWNVFGEVAPGWFRKMLGATIGSFAPIDKAVPIHGGSDYRLRTLIDPVAAATRIWQQVRIASGLAAGLAGTIAFLSAIAVARALKPVSALVGALRRIEAGELTQRLPRSGTREFDRIAAAIDDLASQLQMSLAERKALMKRLFAVQEEERRRLARDLHDEFGQCLAAAGAIAASIEGEAGRENPRLAEDARTLARIHQRMMTSLRSAFSSLRPPDLAEARHSGLSRLAGARMERRARRAHGDPHRQPGHRRHDAGRNRHDRLPDRAGRADQRSQTCRCAACRNRPPDRSPRSLPEAQDRRVRRRCRRRQFRQWRQWPDRHSGAGLGLGRMAYDSLGEDGYADRRDDTAAGMGEG
ncbi:histidine kinase [Jiella pelagia]|uniref:Histidine kinase n=1 Tax=Jiella pelagia TaxID=2986949 RepID=A0ABY7C4J5_9HYPH|nr:histidine kinase [Jiella pelagia]WAP70996.1 histidine kinase [Jiella pelagia]